MNVTIIGAGIGGLSSALYLAKKGFQVTIVEATDTYGGLAKNIQIDGFNFDAGPYILLDKPGLSWAFDNLDLSLNKLDLNKIQNIYSVLSNNSTFTMKSSLKETINGIDSIWQGQGSNYSNFVHDMHSKYMDLQPFTFQKPNKWDVIKSGKFHLIPFVFSSLGKVMDKYKLNEGLKEGIGIWTNIAAQTLYKAPSPMAFVPGLIHNEGSFYPSKGIGEIANILYNTCIDNDVKFRFNSLVKKINTSGGNVTGVELKQGEVIHSDIVISNSNAIGTYVDLIEETPKKYINKITKLPLQSPGISIFMKVKKKQIDSSYIKFKLEDNTPKCKSFIVPDIINKEKGEWKTARLLFPLPHKYSLGLTDEDSDLIVQNSLKEDWWKEGITDFKVLSYNTPNSWSEKFTLYKKSMNPVMTAKFMRMGRIKHKSPYFKGLYFTGSSTHPGQWVSFCSISGIITAKQITKDYS